MNITPDNTSEGKSISPDEKNNNADASVKPDPETLNSTDPQENMKGPISSLVHDAMKKVEDDEGETPDEEKN